MKRLACIIIAITLKSSAFDHIPLELKLSLILQSDARKTIRLMRMTSKKVRSDIVQSFSYLVRQISRNEKMHPIVTAFSVATPEAEDYIAQWMNISKIQTYSRLSETAHLLQTDHEPLLENLKKNTIEQIYRLDCEQLLVQRKLIILSRIFRYNVYVDTLKHSMIDNVDRNSIVMRERMFKDLMDLNMGNNPEYNALFGSLKPTFNTLLDQAIDNFKSHIGFIASYPQLPPVEYCCFIIKTLKEKGGKPSKKQKKCLKKNETFIGNILRCSTYQLPY